MELSLEYFSVKVIPLRPGNTNKIQQHITIDGKAINTNNENHLVNKLKT